MRARNAVVESCCNLWFVSRCQLFGISRSSIGIKNEVHAEGTKFQFVVFTPFKLAVN
jgi:hypothetical protein